MSYWSVRAVRVTGQVMFHCYPMMIWNAIIQQSMKHIFPLTSSFLGMCDYICIQSEVREWTAPGKMPSTKLAIELGSRTVQDPIKMSHSTLNVLYQFQWLIGPWMLLPVTTCCCGLTSTFSSPSQRAWMRIPNIHELRSLPLFHMDQAEKKPKTSNVYKCMTVNDRRPRLRWTGGGDGGWGQGDKWRIDWLVV